MFHKPIELQTAPLIQSLAEELLVDWDREEYQRIVRMPTEGEVFDAVNRELVTMGLSIGIWSIFARKKGGVQRIHVDATSPTNKVHSAIIVPVFGTEGSKFQWFEDAEILKNMDVDGASTYFQAFYSKPPTPIAELEIVSPTIIRVDKPHRAIATTDSPRAIVSIKLTGNPELCSEQ